MLTCLPRGRRRSRPATTAPQERTVAKRTREHISTSARTRDTAWQAWAVFPHDVRWTTRLAQRTSSSPQVLVPAIFANGWLAYSCHQFFSCDGGRRVGSQWHWLYFLTFRHQGSGAGRPCVGTWWRSKQMTHASSARTKPGSSGGEGRRRADSQRRAWGLHMQPRPQDAPAELNKRAATRKRAPENTETTFGGLFLPPIDRTQKVVRVLFLLLLLLLGRLYVRRGAPGSH